MTSKFAKQTTECTCVCSCVNQGNFQSPGFLRRRSAKQILISVDPLGMPWAGSNWSCFCLLFTRTECEYGCMHVELLPIGWASVLGTLSKNLAASIGNFWAATQSVLGSEGCGVVCCTHHVQGTGSVSLPAPTRWFLQQPNWGLMAVWAGGLWDIWDGDGWRSGSCQETCSYTHQENAPQGERLSWRAWALSQYGMVGNEL